MRPARGLAVLICCFFLVGSAVPAGAEVGVGADAWIAPNADLSACATGRFQTTQSVVLGVLTVSGTVAPSTEDHASDTAFADVAPVVLTSTNSWGACVTGASQPVRNGQALYTLTLNGSSGGAVQTSHCIVVEWKMSCTQI